MSNTFLASLSVLNPDSVTSIKSLSLFVNNNGVSQYIDGANLSRYCGTKNYVTFTTTGDGTHPGNYDAGSYFYWQKAIYDPWSCWNTSTKALFVMPFDGVVQVRASWTASNAGSNFGFGVGLRKNATYIQGSRHNVAPYLNYSQTSFLSGPVVVSQNDTIGVVVESEVNPIYLYTYGAFIMIERIA